MFLRRRGDVSVISSASVTQTLEEVDRLPRDDVTKHASAGDRTHLGDHWMLI
jgi:hypothetical protein